MSDFQNSAREAPRVDPEQLAAFLDGRLDDEERLRVLALLDESVEARAILADAVRLMGDPAQGLPLEASGDPAGRAAPTSRASGRSRRRAWVAVVLPAAAAAGLALFFLLPDSGVSGPGTVELAALADASGEFEDPPWTVTRGADIGLAPDQVGFRVGYRLVEAVGRWRVGDSLGARRGLTEVDALLRTQQLSGPARSVIASLTEELDARPGDAVELLASSDRELDRLFSAAWVQLGRIVASARIAALAGDAEALAAPGLDEALDELAGESWPPDVATDLAELTQILSSAPAAGSATDSAIVDRADRLSRSAGG